MLQLVGYDFKSIALGVLTVSLAILVLVIAYRKLLQYLGKGAVNKQDFCVLYPLEETVVKGEVQFYFTCEAPKEYVISILDANMQEVREVQQGNATPGGTIVRFDSTLLSNDSYYYCLKTANQKTMKKMVVRNS